MLGQFCSLTKKIFILVTPKTTKNHQLCATAETKHKDVATKRLRTHQHSGRHWWHHSACQKVVQKNTSLILVNHGVNRLLRAVRHTLDLQQILHLSAGRCSAHIPLEPINLSYNFTRYRLILKLFKADSEVNLYQSFNERSHYT